MGVRRHETRVRRYRDWVIWRPRRLSFSSASPLLQGGCSGPRSLAAKRLEDYFAELRAGGSCKFTPGGDGRERLSSHSGAKCLLGF